MVTIAISGVIADYEMDNESNVTPSTLRRSLEKASGDDILVTINTPGGYVGAGMEMFSLLRNYEGNVETRIVSLAASMGSVIALAGDKKTAESTAGLMVHNPMSCACGDYQLLGKRAEDMRKMAVMFQALYAQRTPVSEAEAKRYMDEETYFYGSEVEKLGFEIIDVPDSDASDRETSLMMARDRMKVVSSRMANEEAASADYEKMAAYLPNTKMSSSASIVVKPSAAGGENQEEGMNLDEFKAKHPDLHAQAVNEGIKQGITQERDRVCAHLTMGEGAGAMDTATKAIRDGEVMTQTLQAEYMTKGMAKRDVEASAADDGDVEAAAGARDGGEGTEQASEEQAEYITSKIERACGVETKA